MSPHEPQISLESIYSFGNSQEQVLGQFATNVFGAMNVTKAVLPHFRAHGSGTTVFMSSISAWHGIGAGGLYSSSKFALEGKPMNIYCSLVRTAADIMTINTGAAECLQKETLHLGLETFIIVLGQFRTRILDPKRRTRRSSNSISAYDAISEELSRRHAETDGKQPGNPKLAVEAILDIVRREGMMEGCRTLPLRIALGSDAVNVVRGKCEETLKDLALFEEFSKSTDFSGASEVPSYR